MDITTYLISVYCLVDDWLKGKRIRQRGPQPQLSDSEVLTMEIVGEFLGIDTDQGFTPSFAGTLEIGFLLCSRWIAPHSLAKRPTCG